MSGATFKMLVVNGFPPNYEAICQKFNIRAVKSVIFCYGDKIYQPYPVGLITYDLLVHEATHQRQQGDDPAGWWKRYLEDEGFRLDQEIEAYRNQYAYLKSSSRDRNELLRRLMRMAADLSGVMYGNLISTNEATALIQNNEQHTGGA